jgi:hypothetical protein
LENQRKNEYKNRMLACIDATRLLNDLRQDHDPQAFSRQRRSKDTQDGLWWSLTLGDPFPIRGSFLVQ